MYIARSSQVSVYPVVGTGEEAVVAKGTMAVDLSTLLVASVS